jgi:hypothetical protein
VKLLPVFIFVVCLSAAGAAEAQAFDPAQVGPPLSGSPAELYLPIGAAPVAAVVVLHGCDGVGPHYREWARRLAGWGYAALLIDSFGPRGFKEVCNQGLLVPPEAQARDAFDGAAYLGTSPAVHRGAPKALQQSPLAGVVKRPPSFRLRRSCRSALLTKPEQRILCQANSGQPRKLVRLRDNARRLQKLFRIDRPKGQAMTTFQDATKEGLKTLVGLWKGGDTFRSPGLKTPCSGGCFWMAGNAFQTAIESMVRTGQPDTFGVSGTPLAQEAVTFFNDAIPNADNPANWGKGEYGYWVDDYGWWGNAFVYAYNNANRLGYDLPFVDTLLGNAANCWEALHACWNSSSITGADQHGIAYTITGGIPNTSDDLLLAGRNCVTNECFWRLSTQLSQAVPAKTQYYLDPKTNANNFFAQAKDLGILFDGNGLVLERFYGLPITDSPNWTWLGDQGLFIACCNYNKYGNGPKAPWQDPTVLFSAIQKEKTTAEGKVLHEDLAPWTDFRLDYACGKGTLMRNLMYLTIDSHNFGGQKSPYDDFLRSNAVALWKNKSTDGHFPFFWNKEDDEPDSWKYDPVMATAVLHAAGLSAINAAGVNWWADSID